MMKHPKGWKYKLLYEIGDAYTGNTPPTKDKNNYGNKFFISSILYKKLVR